MRKILDCIRNSRVLKSYNVCNIEMRIKVMDQLDHVTSVVAI